jgi:hypothetical protein
VDDKVAAGKGVEDVLMTGSVGEATVDESLDWVAYIYTCIYA